jgi:hypothetical protein
MGKVDNNSLFQQCVRCIPRQLPNHLPALLGQVEGMDVYLVDGDLVKVQKYADFVEGGNSYVYKWIPRKPRPQLWIDDNIRRHDLCFVLLHEARESLEMRRGLSYSAGHRIANLVEMEFRRKYRDHFQAD